MYVGAMLISNTVMHWLCCSMACIERGTSHDDWQEWACPTSAQGGGRNERVEDLSGLMYDASRSSHAAAKLSYLEGSICRDGPRETTKSQYDLSYFPTLSKDKKESIAPPEISR